MTTCTANKDELLAAFRKADNAWQDELTAHFGANAGHFRYSRQGQIGPFAATYAERNAARIAYETEAFKQF